MKIDQIDHAKLHKKILTPARSDHMNTRINKQIRIWDLPTRLFHWALAICVIGAIVTVKLGGLWMEWHLRFGVSALALVVFRLVWGVIGPKYARFSEFVSSPLTAWKYLRSDASSARRLPGHNPIGAWSILALLSLIAYQSITGLFSNDDIMVQGPLASYVSGDLSASLTGWHKWTENLILALVGLHMIAILVYRVRGKNLIRPMLTGDVPDTDLAPDSQPTDDGLRVRLLALIIAIVCGTGAWWLINLASQAPSSFS